MNKNLFVFGVLFVFMAGLVYGAQATLVDVGTADTYAVFSDVEVSSTGTTNITGDVGVGDGVTSTAITGNFALSVDATNDFATSSLVTGRVYAYDYTGGQIGSDGLTPAKITTTTGDIGTAYTSAMGQTDAVGPKLNIGAGTVTAQTLTPSVYTWDSGATTTITDDLTLDCQGDSNAVFLFQFKNGGGLQLDANKSIILAGECQSGNIFWAVSGTTDIMAGAHLEGTVLGGPATTEITMITGSTLNGRLLGQKTVALQSNNIIATTPVVYVAPVGAGRGISNGSSGSRAVGNNGTVTTAGTGAIAPATSSFWDRNKAYIIGIGALLLILFILSRVFKGKPTKRG